MKQGLLMSGQGAQQVGMGADLYASLPKYQETIDHASELLGYDVMMSIVNSEDNI